MITGVHPKMTMGEYLALPAFSSGLAHTILAQSPLHAWTDSPFNPMRVRRDSKAMDIGSYAHACLLEGGTDKLVICEFDDWKKKAAQELRDATRDAGKLPILVGKVDSVDAMVAAAKAYLCDSELAGIFDTGGAEQSLIWDEDGLLCKARPDWLSGDKKIILSYKTTAGSASPDQWIRTQLPSYDMATVFYEWAVIGVFPDTEETTCVHLVQEQSVPYSCSLIALAPALADLAQRKLAAAMETWRQCVRSGRFPAYPSRICYAEPKPWQVMEFEEKESAGWLTEKELAEGVPA